MNISCDKMTVSPGYDGFDHVSCFIRGFIFIDHEYIFTVFGRGFEQNSTHKMDMKLDHEVCEFLVIMGLRLNPNNSIQTAQSKRLNPNVKNLETFSDNLLSKCLRGGSFVPPYSCG